MHGSNQESTLGGTTMSGHGNEMKGGRKEAAGKLFGDEGLEAEGAAQKTAGRTERKAEGAFDEAKGAVKKGVGKLIDSPTLQAEGEVDKVKGNVKGA
jgi:uncharacterized protein YjbJ (UPF0337 family)